MMNLNLTKLLLVSASALFLFNQQANAMLPGQEEQGAAAGAATAASYDPSYPDASKVSPERTAVNPRIHGRFWTCEEQREFDESQQTPRTQQANTLLAWVSPFSDQTFHYSLRQVVKGAFPSDQEWTRSEKKRELDRAVNEMVVRATQPERDALEAAKKAAVEESAPYRKQMAGLDQIKSDWIEKHRTLARAGVRVWDDIDEQDYGLKWNAAAKKIEEIYAKHTAAPQAALKAATERARSEAELQQKFARLDLDKEELVASVSATLQSTVRAFESEIAEFIKPVQKIAERRTYNSGVEYRSRLQAFLVQKQNEEIARHFASALSSEPLHKETVSKAAQDNLRSKFLRAISQ